MSLELQVVSIAYFKRKRRLTKSTCDFATVPSSLMLRLRFFGFLRQDVTFESFLMHDFSSTSHFKAFFGAGVCFYFRHFTKYLMLHL